MIIEICTLQLVEDYIISCCNHLVQDIIAGALDFKLVALHFLKVTAEVISAIEEISFLKSTKDGIKFGVPLFK